ncbi:MAG: DUF1559 domain-containing protein [Planctomycetaceae bacterium]
MYPGRPSRAPRTTRSFRATGPRRRRRGFTVPELAVVMAVIVCLLAAAAPYLLKMWEVSRQAQCRERMTRLAIGITQLQQTRNNFPAGQVARRSKSNSIGRYADPDEAAASSGDEASGASWMVAVLPHIDAKDLFDRWKAKTSVAANRDVAETTIALQICPSRRSGGGLLSGCERIDADWTGGGNDYAACSGSGITFNDEARQTWDLEEMQIEATTRDGNCPYSNAPHQRGLFGVNSAVTNSDLDSGDGKSHILMLAERRVFRNASGPVELRSSDGWAWGGPATLFSTRFAPHTGLHYDEADSAHPGLVHVALADGRVRPISWNIDLQTWSNLGNFAQGSPLEHPDFR